MHCAYIQGIAYTVADRRRLPVSPAPTLGEATGCPNKREASFVVFDNDPSAGSPTETLLRLLLPLDSQV